MTTSADESWVRPSGHTAYAGPGRTGLLTRFEREARERLGPHASDLAVADAAESACKAHYARLSEVGAAVSRAGGEAM
jgi:hypothetical protein